MAESLKEKTAKGLFWGAMNNGAMQVIGLLFGIYDKVLRDQYGDYMRLPDISKVNLHVSKLEIY